MPFIPLDSADQAVDSAPDTQSGFIPLADNEASGFAPDDSQLNEPGKTSVLRNVLLNNPLTAIGETALNLGTMAVALPTAGLAGLGTLASNALGLSDRNPADVVRGVGEAMTYQPRGELGQAATSVATYPFEKLGEGGQYAGTKTLDATGSPVLATAVDSAINLLPMTLAPGVRMVRRNRPPVAPVEPIVTESAAADASRTSDTAVNDAQPQGVAAPVNAVTTDTTAAQRGFTPLETAAPDVTQTVDAAPPPDITPHLAAGVEELATLKDSGASVPDAMAQAGIHSEQFTPESRQLASFLADNAGDPAKLAEFQNAYRDALATVDQGFTPLEKAAPNENPISRSKDAGNDPQAAGTGGFKPGNETGSEGGYHASGIPDTAAQVRPSAAHFTLVEADELKLSHDANLRPNDAYPDQLKDPNWNRAEAEKTAQSIMKDFDPAKLAESVDDSTGAPMMAPDGVVEAGKKRVTAIQRVYQANGAKAEAYRTFLRDNSDSLGVDPAEIDSMKRPVLVRVPDEPIRLNPITDNATDLPPDGKANAAMVPGANYVGFITDQPKPGTLATDTTKARPEPMRREDILIPFAKALGTGIYEGRITSKKVLGFFRPKQEEVRIKRHADLETAAHELAHLIDHRVPEIRKTWHSGPDWQIHREELRGLSYDKSKIYEGFAEFVRHYMTQPDVAKARAPVFYKWFTDFAARHEYGPAIAKAQKGMTDWFNQDAIDRARSKIGDHNPMTDALDGKWDSFRQATVDDLHGVYRMERELTGGKIAPNGPYESARLSRASSSIADGAIRFGAPVKKADGSFGWQGKGLEEIMRPVSENMNDALLYFVGRSARELQAQGREHLFTMGETDAMLKLKRPEFETAFKEYQGWNTAVMDFAEAHGVINPQTRKMWQRLDYLPFHRVGSPDGGFKGKAGDWSGIKALTGGTENIRDVLGNITRNAAMLIRLAVKNEARLKIAALAGQAGGGKFMTKIPAESRPVKVATSAVMDAVLKGMGLDKTDSPAAAKAAQRVRKMLEDAPAMLELMQTNMPPAGGNVVAVLKDGKPIWYEVGDPILLRALESIDRTPPPWIVKWLGLPKRIGQASIVLTPDFMIANIARDTIMGGVMSRAGFVPIIDSLKGMRLRLTNDPIYKQYCLVRYFL